MIPALLLIPRLAHAIACLVIIIIAAPLLALFDDRRRSHRGHHMTDYDKLFPENPENTRDERVLLEVADALDVAGAPRTHAERSGGDVDIELDVELALHARVRWLMNDRDDKAKDVTLWRGRCTDARELIMRSESVLRDAGAPMGELMVDQNATWLVRELKTKCTDLASLSKLCGEVQHDRDFFRTQAEERCATIAGLMRQRDALQQELAEARRAGITCDDKKRELDTLALQLDAASIDRTLTLTSQAEALRDERDASRRALALTEANLSELHIKLRQALGVESTAKALEEVTMLKDLADNAEGWRMACATHERTVARLTSERADAEARADALEAELAMLEAHVDDLDAELGKRLDPAEAMDCWLGWDGP